MIPFVKLERWNEVPLPTNLLAKLLGYMEKYVPISGTISHNISLGNASDR
jgi:hypothetical protein